MEEYSLKDSRKYEDGEEACVGSEKEVIIKKACVDVVGVAHGLGLDGQHCRQSCLRARGSLTTRETHIRQGSIVLRSDTEPQRLHIGVPSLLLLHLPLLCRQ